MLACLVDSYATFFSYYIRQQTILADITVGCQSNGRRVSSISDLLAPAAKAAPAGPPAPASHGRLCCRAGLNAPYYSHHWPGHPSTHPHPLLFCSDGSQPNRRTLVLLSVRASTIVSSPALRRPLPRPRHRPRRGALGMVWSMWSTTDFHRKSTLRGETDSWAHAGRKEVPPYYTQNSYFST